MFQNVNLKSADSGQFGTIPGPVVSKSQRAPLSHSSPGLVFSEDRREWAIRTLVEISEESHQSGATRLAATLA